MNPAWHLREFLASMAIESRIIVHCTQARCIAVSVTGVTYSKVLRIGGNQEPRLLLQALPVQTAIDLLGKFFQVFRYLNLVGSASFQPL
jgi:hypothetical protein